MKSFFLVVAFAAFVSVQALTDEQKNTLRERAKECIASSGADPVEVKKMREGDYSSSDPKLASFSYCMFKKTGLMNEDGSFNRDVAVSKVEEENREAVGKAIDACLEKVGTTNEEIAWNYVKCYHSARPNHEIF